MSTELEQELEMLKTRANLLGIKYHPSISISKLREKIEETSTTKNTPTEVSNEEDLRSSLIREANKLVRVRITCMNPSKKDWEGEIITVSNTVVGTFKKYIPFNADEGWHVPQIILNMLNERMCQIFQSVPDGRGNMIRKGKLVKEFSIEVLPDLTPSELHDLAQRQSMSKTVE